jgi:hypothetical protein
MLRGEISIADVLRSLASLKPGNAEALETLCALLHVELAPSAVSAPDLEKPKPPASRPPAAGVPPPPPASGALPSQLRLLPPREEAPMPWAEIAPLPAHPMVVERPAMEPLLPPLVRTAILSTAIATRENAGEVDLEQAVDVIASGRALTRLERRPVPSLRRGVQVLADVGEGMLPYAGDRSELITAIQASVGKEQTGVLMFAGTPLRRAGQGPRHTWGRWAPPPRGTPVLLLTELGLGGPVISHDRASLGEWLRFCEETRRAGCPVLAFVPHEPRRWPPELTRAMTILLWDRGTTVSIIRHAARRGNRRRS